MSVGREAGSVSVGREAGSVSVGREADHGVVGGDNNITFPLLQCEFSLNLFVADPLAPCSWLQPDRAVDPEASELEVPSDPVQVGVAAEFTVRTKDQDGKLVFVESMKVSWRRGKRRRRRGRVFTFLKLVREAYKN